MTAFEAEVRVLAELEAIVHRYRNGHRGAAAGPEGVEEAARRARAVYRARRARTQIFGTDADLFAEPAWDILLDLFVASAEGTPVSVSSACIAAAVPSTTALRWLATLETRGLLERTTDPADGRRCYLRLTETAQRRMQAWLAQRR